MFATLHVGFCALWNKIVKAISHLQFVFFCPNNTRKVCLVRGWQCQQEIAWEHTLHTISFVEPLSFCSHVDLHTAVLFAKAQCSKCVVIHHPSRNHRLCLMLMDLSVLVVFGRYENMMKQLETSQDSGFQFVSLCTKKTNLSRGIIVNALRATKSSKYS